MKLHPQSGTRVFVDGDDEAVLLAYRRLLHTYLVLVYTRGAAWYGATSFDAVLDAVPVHSMPVHVVLNLDATIETTLHGWLSRVHESLTTCPLAPARGGVRANG